jgi:PAS domain S-box-containing protein
MNIFAAISLASLIICLLIVVTLYHQTFRRRIDWLTAVLSLVCGWWALVNFGFAISKSYEEAMIWRVVISGWPLGICFALYFSMVFAGWAHVFRRHAVQLIFFGPPLYFTGYELVDSQVFGQPVESANGWVPGLPNMDLASVMALVWVVGACLFVIGVLSYVYAREADRWKRLQARGLLIGCAIPAATAMAGVASTFLGRPFGFLTVVGMTLGCLIAGYSVWRYNVLALTPVTAADSILSTMTDMLFLVGPEERILTANSASHLTLGYAGGELVGRPVETVFSDPALVESWLTMALDEEAESVDEVRDMEVSFVTKEGVIIPVSLSGAVVRHEWGAIQGVLLIGRDIGARKRADREQRELRVRYEQTQKMESIGRLAGGVAHDMNNILGAVMASGFSIEAVLPPGSPEEADVKTILSACYRGRDLSQNLLGFARKGKYVKEIIYFNSLIKEIITIVERTISKRLVIRAVLNRSLSLIEGDRAQLQGAVMNVCLNAAEAMDGVGTMTLRTDNTALERPMTTLADPLEPGPYVRLSIADTGRGMDERTAKKALEPFFTTKPRSKGSGLGLSMAYGVVANHGGAIFLDSRLDVGTTVTFYIPASGKTEPKPESRIRRKRAGEFRGAGAILLVDDEDLILLSSRKLLEKLGYTVLIAENGRAALETYRNHGKSISLVLLDMLMPVMDGVETFHRLRAIDPQAKVLLFSGYNRDDQVNALLEDGAIGYLQKPFDIQMLINELSTALET